MTTYTKTLPVSELSIANLLSNAPRAVTVRVLDDEHATVRCEDRFAHFSRCGSAWQLFTETRGEWIVEHGCEVISDRQDVRIALHWVAGTCCVDADGETRCLESGMWVESATHEDYDRGEVIDVSAEDGKIAIAWEGGACVQKCPAQAIDGLVVHEVGVRINWRLAWPELDD